MESKLGPDMTEVRVLVQLRMARAGLGPSPGWGPVRVGAHMGPYGAHMGPPGQVRT